MEETKHKTLPFLDHLEELRFRIIYTLATFVVCTILAFLFKEKIYEFLTVPARDLDIQFIHLRVTDKFMAYLKISLYTGIVLSFPVIVYQVIRFVLPALYHKEVKWLYRGMAFVVILFFMGSFLAYRVITPYSFKFFIEFGRQKESDEAKMAAQKEKDKVKSRHEQMKEQMKLIGLNFEKMNELEKLILKSDKQTQPGKEKKQTPKIKAAELKKKLEQQNRLYKSINNSMIVNQKEIYKTLQLFYKDIIQNIENVSKNNPLGKIHAKKDTKDILSLLSIADYFDWIIFFILIIGVVFQLPLILMLLAKIGIVNDRMLAKFRPYAFITILVVAAIITPPDVITQLLVGGPVYLLYELSIFLTMLMRKKSEKEWDEIAKDDGN